MPKPAALAAVLLAAFAATLAPAAGQAQNLPGQQAALDALDAPKLALKGRWLTTYDDEDAMQVIRWPVEKKGDLALVYTLEFLPDAQTVNGKEMTMSLQVAAFDCKAKTARALGSAAYDKTGQRIAGAPGGFKMEALEEDNPMALTAAMACKYEPKEDELYDSWQEAEGEARELFVEDALADLADVLKSLPKDQKKAEAPAKPAAK